MKDVIVTVAWEKVKSSWSVKDQEITISLKDVELAAKDNSEFVVSVELSNDFDNFGGQTNLMLAKLTDVTAVESKTDSRVTATTLAAYDTTGKDWYTCTFNWGKIRIESNKLGNIDASENSTDIVIAEWEIQTAQTIKTNANGIRVTVTPSAARDVIQAMRIVIAGDEYEGTKHTTAWVIDYFDFPSVEVDHTSKIKILVDTVEQWGTKWDYVNFTIQGLKGYDGTTYGFYYDDVKGNVAADMAGSLDISQLTLTPSKATLTNKISSDEVEFKAGKTSKQTILSGTYTAKKTDVYLNEFSLEWAAAADWDAVHTMDVYLYLGGKLVADDTLDATNNKWIATDTFTNVLVKAGESVDVELVAQVEAGTTNLKTAVKFDLTLVGEDENGNPNSWEASKQTAKISIVTVGTPEVTDEVTNNIVLLRWSEGAIAEFRVKPSGSSSMDLESVTFDQPAGVTCSDLKLTVGNVDENFKLDTVKSVCYVDGFSENIEKNGAVLRIEFENEPPFSSTLINAAVKHLVLNNTSISKEFSKAYADAVLTFNQRNNTDKTEFTIATIEKYNSTAEVYDLHFYDENDNEIQTNGMLPSKALSVNDKFTAYNLKKTVPVKKIRYTVKRGSDVQVVEITYDPYKDSFKTNDSDLQTYAYGDAEKTDTNTVTATVVAPTSLPAVVAGWLDVTSIDKVQ